MPSATSMAATSSLRTGDLIFVRPRIDASSALDKAILATGAATIEWLRAHGVEVASNETALHVAMAWRNETDGDALSLIEAVPPAVRVTPASMWFDEWRDSAAAYYTATFRVDPPRPIRLRAADVALSQVGKPYALDFGKPPAEFYCSSLVDWAYQHALGSSHVFVDSPFTLIFIPRSFWTDYYARLNVTLPSNQTGSNPTLLLHSPHVRFSKLRPPSRWTD
jgi:hypothetical protein